MLVLLLCGNNKGEEKKQVKKGRTEQQGKAWRKQSQQIEMTNKEWVSVISLPFQVIVGGADMDTAVKSPSLITEP